MNNLSNNLAKKKIARKSVKPQSHYGSNSNQSFSQISHEDLDFHNHTPQIRGLLAV
jgi:hypothetical protein